jgi:hypothetical protein
MILMRETMGAFIAAGKDSRACISPSTRKRTARASLLHRAGDQPVDGPDGRGVAGQILQALQVGQVGGLVDGYGARGVGAVEPFQRRLHIAGPRHLGPDRRAQRQAQCLQRIGVDGIDQGRFEPGRVVDQDHRAHVTQEPLGDLVGRQGRWGIVGGLGQRQAARLGDQLGQRLF